MGAITRGDILGAIHGVTGNPSSGPIADWSPVIAEAIDELINGKPEAPAKENRVVKASDTPESAAKAN
jgi:cytochrome c5